MTTAVRTPRVDPRILKHEPDASLALAEIDALQPNMSPTVFQTLLDVVGGYRTPTILESGIGISTYHLCRQLQAQGGALIGVEHNAHWFGIIEAWILRLLTRTASAVPLEQHRRTCSLVPHGADRPLIAVDSTFLSGPLTVTLLLRQATGQTGDGTLEEFYDYVHAVNGTADVIVVDGRARLPLLERIRAERMVAPGGTLFLHDAPTYRDGALARFPGGRFLDGRGGFKNAFRPDQEAKPFMPQEAFVWTAPRGEEASAAE